MKNDYLSGLARLNRRPQPRNLVSATAALLCVIAAACGSDKPSTGLPVTTPGAGFAGSSAPPVTLPTAGATAVKPPTTGVTTPPPAGTAGSTGTPGTAGTGSSMVGDVTQPSANDVMPCAVNKVLASNCTTCHAATPIAGAPMPLVTFADLHKPAVTQPTMKVFQVVKTRIHDMARPMPPTQVKPLAAPDLAMLDTWLDGGALAGTAADKMCDTVAAPTGTVTPGRVDGGRGALVPLPGETCYEFKTHNSTTSVDNVPYDVGGDGEHYEQFYFNIPWPKGVLATAYATKIDNAAVLHHWLTFSTEEDQQEGYHMTAPLPTLIGTNPVLLAGWAVGGPNLVAPDDVGLELPDPGQRHINVQWHFYNTTGKDQKDASSVQICTVPVAMRAHVGSITWLGTEDLNGNKWTGGAGMPPHMMSTFTTTCVPGRAGMNATDSIHIIGFEPHMHRIGKNMKTTVKHTNGMMDVIFDKPFSFGNETHYYMDYEVKPGEQLTTSCSFDNDNDFGVPFGESSDTEMCYQFTYAWPAHAMSNGAFSLLGVPDTCW